jgi:hypothetical protein
LKNKRERKSADRRSNGLPSGQAWSGSECANRSAASETKKFDEAGFSLTPSVPYGWQMIPKWEEKNLFLWFLPSYSPELNLIELLWKQIKYRWMPLNAYDSFEALTQSLDHVLASIGNKFKIVFK